MRLSNSENNVETFGGLVNGLAALVIITLIGTAYVSALGSFAGIV